MSDAEMTKDEIEKEKKWILENIKRGMDKKIK